MAPEIYDKAKYHTDGEYPKGRSPRQAYVHTGMFLGWLASKDLLSKEFEHDFVSDIQSFREGKITGPQLYARADGVLDGSMLSEEGNRFARSYFEFEKGGFIADYEELLVQDLPSFYHVEDSWSNYRRLAAAIDQRYAQWKKETVRKN